MAAQRVGFKMVDSFTLLAKSRIISSGKYKNGQKHSRNYISKFLIFKKESKVRNKEFNHEKLLDIWYPNSMKTKEKGSCFVP